MNIRLTSQAEMWCDRSGTPHSTFIEYLISVLNRSPGSLSVELTIAVFVLS